MMGTKEEIIEAVNRAALYEANKDLKRANDTLVSAQYDHGQAVGRLLRAQKTVEDLKEKIAVLVETLND